MVPVDQPEPAAEPEPPAAGFPVSQSKVTDKPIVFVIDDDDSVRRSLKRLLRSVDLDVETFASAQDSYASRCRTVKPAWCSTCACRG